MSRKNFLIGHKGIDRDSSRRLLRLPQSDCYQEPRWGRPRTREVRQHNALRGESRPRWHLQTKPSAGSPRFRSIYCALNHPQLSFVRVPLYCSFAQSAISRPSDALRQIPRRIKTYFSQPNDNLQIAPFQRRRQIRGRTFHFRQIERIGYPKQPGVLGFN